MLVRVVPFFVSVPLALFALSCSDPPPSPAAGGVSISLSPPSKMYTQTRSCNAGTNSAFTYKIGDPNPGGTIEDGKQNVKVECLVKADGSFNARIGGTDMNGGKPASFSFTGAIKDPKNAMANTGVM